MDNAFSDEVSHQQLDSFLSDLRQGLASHLAHLLGVTFGLHFPDSAQSALNPGRPCRFEEWVAGASRPEIEASAPYQDLVARHRALHEQAAECLADSAAGRLEVAELAAFLRAEGDFQSFADHLEREVATALIEVDEVTGLKKRHAMERELREEVARARRGKTPLVVAMADIDHFKRINDTYGHPFGDQVLAQLASRLTAGVRPYDRVYRYGGEEFLLLLPETSRRRALSVLERLRERIAAVDISDGRTTVKLTLSIGVAEFASGGSPERLIKEADAALYRAKQAGRNRVETD